MTSEKKGSSEQPPATGGAGEQSQSGTPPGGTTPAKREPLGRALLRRAPTFFAILMLTIWGFWLIVLLGKTSTGLDSITAERGTSVEQGTKQPTTEGSANTACPAVLGETETTYARVFNNALRLLLISGPLGLTIWGLVRLGRDD